MTLDEYVHKHLLETDDWYKSLGTSDQNEFMKVYKNSFYGLRLIAEYYIDKYVRRDIK